MTSVDALTGSDGYGADLLLAQPEHDPIPSPRAPTTSPERVQTLLGPLLRRSPPVARPAVGQLLYEYGA